WASPTRRRTATPRSSLGSVVVPRLDPADSPVAPGARLGLLNSSPSTAEPTGERRYINRELSTLDFNARVLAMAENEELPLLERIKFLAIFSSAMDEFFQVRVAGLKDQQAAGLSGTAPDGLSVSDQLSRIRAVVETLFAHRRAAFIDDILPRLAK